MSITLGAGESRGGEASFKGAIHARPSIRCPPRGSSMNRKSDPHSQNVIASICVRTLLVAALLMSICPLAREKDDAQGASEKPQLSEHEAH